MFCPICGKGIEDDKEQFCKYCKADLSEKPTNEESLKVLCPNCGKEVDVGNGEVSFCKFCGSELTEESINEQTTVITCPHCNKKMDIGHGDAKFCKHCGSNIYGEKLPMYCHNCGKEIDEADSESMFCKYCGAKFGEAFTMSNQPKLYKSPGVAIFLSFLWTGAGQLYNGEIAKGMILVIITLILFCLCFIPGVALVIIIPILIYWIWGMVDANRSAKRLM
jgi:TM2 domain-containing membrane protein YozV/DNA-directed RNA polymerase subunit RPC12/RpoP